MRRLAPEGLGGTGKVSTAALGRTETSNEQLHRELLTLDKGNRLLVPLFANQCRAESVHLLRIKFEGDQLQAQFLF